MTGNHLDRRPPTARRRGRTAPGITNDCGWALYDSWLAGRGLRIVPPQRAIDPALISPRLSRGHLLEQKADGSFLWRSMGAGLAALFGRDLTGRTFDPAASPRHDWRFLAIYTTVGNQPCGVVLRCLARTARGRVTRIETLALPLLDDAGCANRVLAHSEVLDLGPREFQRFGPLTELKIAGFDFFDIGAGTPPGAAFWQPGVRTTELVSRK